MIDGILGWMGTKYGERGTERHPGELSTYSAMLWNRLRTEGSNFGQPVNYGHGMFSVRTGTSSQVSVDLVARTCSCLEFQEMQFPCVHAVKCIDRSELARRLRLPCSKCERLLCDASEAGSNPRHSSQVRLKKL